MRDLQYPIGEFVAPDVITDEQVAAWIDELEALPNEVARVVEPLTPAQLDTPYRPGGWTVRQVVHHIGDSHMNSLVRFKWALTEDCPTIKAYFEERWAELADYTTFGIPESIAFFRSIQSRLVVLLRSLTNADLERSFIHPETGDTVVLRTNIGIYAWHGRHHLAHITKLLEREGW